MRRFLLPTKIFIRLDLRLYCMAKVAKQQHNLINVVMDGSASINHQKTIENV